MNNRIDQTLAEQMTGMTSAEKVATLFDYMERRGQSFYDESVTQLEHACQCANQAQLYGGSTTQVTSALLHDMGHFLLDEHNAESDFLDEDQNHEEIGADYLEPFFRKWSQPQSDCMCQRNGIYAPPTHHTTKAYPRHRKGVFDSRVVSCRTKNRQRLNESHIIKTRSSCGGGMTLPR